MMRNSFCSFPFQGIWFLPCQILLHFSPHRNLFVYLILNFYAQVVGMVRDELERTCTHCLYDENVLKRGPVQLTKIYCRLLNRNRLYHKTQTRLNRAILQLHSRHLSKTLWIQNLRQVYRHSSNQLNLIRPWFTYQVNQQ